MKANVIKLSCLGLVLLFFCYRSSGVIAGDSRKECLAAIILVVSVSLIGFLPVYKAFVKRKRNFFAVAMSASFIRLIGIFALAALVVVVTDLRKNVFLIWASIAYFIVLTLETINTVRMSNTLNKDNISKDFFEDHDDDIIISRD